MQLLSFSRLAAPISKILHRQGTPVNSVVHYARSFSSATASSPLRPQVRRHGQTATKEERREFMGAFPDVVRDLTADPDQKIPDVEKWYHKVLQYNVPAGRKSRGLAVVSAFKTLTPEDKISDENLQKALIAGWCVELLHNALVVQDDLMCRRMVRRGRPSWHNVDGVGLKAVNDALMMENGLYYLLWKTFKDDHFYPRLMELFHQVTMKTATGRLLAALSYHEDGSPDYTKFTMDRYLQITKFKQSYCSFVLPISVGMFVSGIDAPELHRQAKTVLVDMGEFYQIQDDFLDSFGDASEDRLGSEIEDGKHNWMAVIFLQRAPPKLIEHFKNNYGVKDPKAVSEVRRLYEEIKLPQLFSAYEEQTYRTLYDEIQRCSAGVPKGLMMKFMEKLLNFSAVP